MLRTLGFHSPNFRRISRTENSAARSFSTPDHAATHSIQFASIADWSLFGRASSASRSLALQPRLFGDGGSGNRYSGFCGGIDPSSCAFEDRGTITGQLAITRPQFSIRSLLWLTLVVAILCVVGPPLWREAQNRFFPAQEIQLRPIVPAGAVLIVTEEGGDSWQRQKRVEALEIRGFDDAMPSGGR